MGLQLTLTAAVEGQWSQGGHAADNVAQLGLRTVLDFITGAGAKQANQVYAGHRALAASASESLDLNGALADVFSGLVNAVAIKALWVQADAANTGDIKVGGAGANAVLTLFGTNTDSLRIQPGGFAVVATPSAGGYAVVGGTADLLKVANLAAAAGGYTIFVLATAVIDGGQLDFSNPDNSGLIGG